VDGETRASGNFSCGAFNSCKHAMSGFESSSHPNNTLKRPLTPLTLKVDPQSS
jgi:hypothetical protein